MVSRLLREVVDKKTVKPKSLGGFAKVLALASSSNNDPRH